MDPTLDATQLRQLLHDSARADHFTGATPNPEWGYGKVVALAALDRLHAQLTHLTVTPVDATAARISARGQPGKRYVFESSDDLVHWQPAQTNTAAAAPFELRAAPEAQARFVRLVRPAS